MAKALVINVDDELANRHAVAKRQVPGIAFKSAIDDESRNQSLMDRPDVSNRVPDGFASPSDLNLFANACHLASRISLRSAVRYFSGTASISRATARRSARPPAATPL